MHSHATRWTRQERTLAGRDVLLVLAKDYSGFAFPCGCQMRLYPTLREALVCPLHAREDVDADLITFI